MYILTIWTLLGTLFLTACQSDVLLTEQKDINQPVVGMRDSSFINLRIVSTSQPITRSTEAATTKENAIYDGILCIFEGTSEATCTLKTATVIDQLISNPGTAGASVDVQVTQRLVTGTHAYNNNNNLYVLALLNTSSTGLYAKGGKLYKRVSSGTDTQLTGSTLSQLQDLKIDSVGNTNEHVGLFMANKNGTLPQVTNTYLFDTPEQAKTAEDTRLTIEVERAAAKVKLVNNIPAGTALSNITLEGGTTEHPLIHKMTWMVNQYNSGAFAVGGGSSDTGTPDNNFAAKDFTYFHQHSLKSGDEVYVGPNNNATETQVVVEIQLKDGSFLMGDCFAFKNWDNTKLFTNVETLKEYYINGWDLQKQNYNAIKYKSADAVFRNLKVVIDDDDHVVVTLTNSDFTATEQQALNSLAGVLSGMTTYFRDGKMYYTFTLDELKRNNAYNLSLVEEAATDTRQTSVTFKFDQGTSGGSGTITFSNSTADLFASSSITLGSNFAYHSWNSTFSQTLVNPKTDDATDNLDFLITPATGWTFTPSQVSFSTTRYGTDGGLIDVSWINSGGGSTVSVATGIKPYRNNGTPNILEWSSSVTAGSVGDGACGLRLGLSNLKTGKQVGFSDIVITGTLSKASGIASPQKSISGIGRPRPTP